MQVYIVTVGLLVVAAAYDVARRYVRVLHERTSRDASHVRELHVVKLAVHELQKQEQQARREVRDLKDQLHATGEHFAGRVQTLEVRPAQIQLADEQQLVARIGTLEDQWHKQSVWNDQQDAILQKLHRELPERFVGVDQKLQDLDRRIGDAAIRKQGSGTYAGR